MLGGPAVANVRVPVVIYASEQLAAPEWPKTTERPTHRPCFVATFDDDRHLRYTVAVEDQVDASLKGSSDSVRWSTVAGHFALAATGARMSVMTRCRETGA